MCGGRAVVERVRCEGCDVTMEGDFELPRLARLSVEGAKLAELFLLFDGSLKRLSSHLEISYPTVRDRMNRLIAELEGLVREDAKEASPARKRRPVALRKAHAS